ncbi:MAG TPA: hypothetical protein VIL92_06485, partial [Gaiellaceae bacterium]
VAACLAACMVTLGVVVGSSAAATAPSFTFDCAGDVNMAACERLTYIAGADANIAEATSAQAAALADSSHRSDLLWQGIWAVVGLLLVVLLAPFWRSAWGLEGKLGRG